MKFRHARFFDGFGQVTGTEVIATDSRLSRGMTYTQNGKLESVQESESRAGVVLRSRTTSYTYDQRDRLTAEVFVSGLVVDNEPSHRVTNGYDLNGNRVIVTADVVATPAMPATTRETRSTFDRANRVVTITDAGRALAEGGFASTTYAYDSASNRLSVQRPDGIVDASSYDALNRVQQATTTGPGQALGNLYQVSYTYDLVGNRRTASESTIGLGSRSLVYAYDQQYRLTGEAETTATRSRSSVWRYDQAGNRTQQIQTLTETLSPAVVSNRTTTTEYDVDVLNRLSGWTATTVTMIDGITGVPNVPSAPSIVQCQYRYDANGNQIEDTQTLTSNAATRVVSKRQRFQWDGLNRLIAVSDLLPTSETTIFTAEYDARTRRRLTHEGTTTTQFRYDGGDAYQEHTPQGPTAFFARGSSMGGGIGGILYSDRRSAAGPIETFVYNPAVGHTVGTVGSDAQVVSANTYDAFGQIIDRIGNSANSRLANTKERSASIGLDNHGFRYYNPQTGRYISKDPAQAGFNHYIYASNNPVNRIDPLGLDDEEGGFFSRIGGSLHAIGNSIASGFGTFSNYNPALQQQYNPLLRAKAQGGGIETATNVAFGVAVAATALANPAGASLIQGTGTALVAADAAVTSAAINGATRVAAVFGTDAATVAMAGAGGAIMAEGFAVPGGPGSTAGQIGNLATKMADEAVDFLKGAKAAENGVVSASGTVAANITAQAKNIDRFTDKIPTNAKDSVVTRPLPNGGVAAQAASPGRVPGSSAVYEKQIGADGTTLNYTKTTYAPDGGIIHVKDKISGETHLP